MKTPGIRDFVIWDSVNWGKAIRFWEKEVSLHDKQLKCLELGSNQGGLSLWLRSLGHTVCCSDLSTPEKIAQPYHTSFGFNDISYMAIDATNIPFEKEFDIITFKSMLGGASRGDRDENKGIVMEQIHRALRPGGKLLFAENLKASAMHQYFRKRFVGWGDDWNYLAYSEIKDLLDGFSYSKYFTVGCFGTLGRNEGQRRVLGHIDNITSFAVPESSRYIVIGVATK